MFRHTRNRDREKLQRFAHAGRSPAPTPHPGAEAALACDGRRQGAVPRLPRYQRRSHGKPDRQTDQDHNHKVGESQRASSDRTIELARQATRQRGDLTGAYRVLTVAAGMAGYGPRLALRSGSRR